MKDGQAYTSACSLLLHSKIFICQALGGQAYTSACSCLFMARPLTARPSVSAHETTDNGNQIELIIFP